MHAIVVFAASEKPPRGFVRFDPSQVALARYDWIAIAAGDSGMSQSWIGRIINRLSSHTTDIYFANGFCLSWPDSTFFPLSLEEEEWRSSQN